MCLGVNSPFASISCGYSKQIRIAHRGYSRAVRIPCFPGLSYFFGGVEVCFARCVQPDGDPAPKMLRFQLPQDLLFFAAFLVPFAFALPEDAVILGLLPFCVPAFS